MSKDLLQKYCDSLNKESLSILEYNFKNFNVQDDFMLFDYQIEALENIAVFLELYFSKDGHYKVLSYYNNILSKETKNNLTIPKESDLFEILIENDFLQVNNQIDFSNFINRACFWMATGSGKTVIIVKLIELLFNFMKNRVIPNKNILIVAPNDKLINQIKDHVKIFNKCTSKTHQIIMKDLKDFERTSFSGERHLAPDSLYIYYTRSSLVSNENKENEFDYKTYILKEGWYLILDEAHKGEQKNSKRKAYLSALAKNGFLFNFSATFTDLLDKVSTIYNFNLPEFIKAGYGKNLKILDEEFKYFKAKTKKEKKDNLNNNKKGRIILKSFIIFTVLKRITNKLKKVNNLYSLGLNYHNPLMVTISNQINTKEADMKLYFQYVADLAKTNVKKEILDDIKYEIINNLKDNFLYIVGDDLLSDKIIEEVASITNQDILRNVFYAKSPGEIEVNEISGNTEELTFKLKTSDKPFALINASDINKWKKNILDGYFFNDDILSESRFTEIKNDDNEINILMGSRKFIEGWDSNRPNIMNFINMGVDDENIKLILQAIGRGVRIEPKKNLRKRLNKTKNFIKYSLEIQEKLICLTSIIETLFIFATNKQVVKNIIEDIDKDKDNWVNIKGINKTKITKKLIVPVYDNLKYNDKPINISVRDFELVDNYIENNSEKLLIVRDNFNSNIIKKIKAQNKIIVKDIESKYKKPIDVYRVIENHFNTKMEEVIGYRKEKSIDIEHYKKIKINITEKAATREELIDLEHVLLKKIEKTYSKEQNDVIQAIKGMGKTVFLKNEYMQKQAENLGLELDELFTNISKDDLKFKYQIDLKNIEQHYYNPIIISKDNSKYKHIIKIDSEIDFLERLEEYLLENEHEINLDWWYFSKLDEYIDRIYIPYFDSTKQKPREFYPDFIFWMKKEQDYYIKFVDPKGLSREANPLDKIKGYENTFLRKDATYNGNDIKTELLYYNKESSSREEIEKYRFYDISKIFCLK